MFKHAAAAKLQKASSHDPPRTEDDYYSVSNIEDLAPFQFDEQESTNRYDCAEETGRSDTTFYTARTESGVALFAPNRNIYNNNNINTFTTTTIDNNNNTNNNMRPEDEAQRKRKHHDLGPSQSYYDRSKDPRLDPNRKRSRPDKPFEQKEYRSFDDRITPAVATQQEAAIVISDNETNEYPRDEDDRYYHNKHVTSQNHDSFRRPAQPARASIEYYPHDYNQQTARPPPQDRGNGQQWYDEEQDSIFPDDSASMVMSRFLSEPDDYRDEGDESSLRPTNTEKFYDPKPTAAYAEPKDFKSVITAGIKPNRSDRNTQTKQSSSRKPIVSNRLGSSIFPSRPNLPFQETSDTDSGDDTNHSRGNKEFSSTPLKIHAPEHRSMGENRCAPTTSASKTQTIRAPITKPGPYRKDNPTSSNHMNNGDHTIDPPQTPKARIKANNAIALTSGFTRRAARVKSPAPAAASSARSLPTTIVESQADRGIRSSRRPDESQMQRLNEVIAKGQASNRERTKNASSPSRSNQPARSMLEKTDLPKRVERARTVAMTPNPRHRASVAPMISQGRGGGRERGGGGAPPAPMVAQSAIAQNQMNEFSSLNLHDNLSVTMDDWKSQSELSFTTSTPDELRAKQQRNAQRVQEMTKHHKDRLHDAKSAKDDNYLSEMAERKHLELYQRENQRALEESITQTRRDAAARLRNGTFSSPVAVQEDGGFLAPTIIQGDRGSTPRIPRVPEIDDSRFDGRMSTTYSQVTGGHRSKSHLSSSFPLSADQVEAFEITDIDRKIYKWKNKFSWDQALELVNKTTGNEYDVGEIKARYSLTKAKMASIAEKESRDGGQSFLKVRPIDTQEVRSEGETAFPIEPTWTEDLNQISDPEVLTMSQDPVEIKTQASSSQSKKRQESSSQKTPLEPLFSTSGNGQALSIQTKKSQMASTLPQERAIKERLEQETAVRAILEKQESEREKDILTKQVEEETSKRKEAEKKLVEQAKALKETEKRSNEEEKKKLAEQAKAAKEEKKQAVDEEKRKRLEAEKKAADLAEAVKEAKKRATEESKARQRLERAELTRRNNERLAENAKKRQPTVGRATSNGFSFGQGDKDDGTLEVKERPKLKSRNRAKTSGSTQKGHNDNDDDDDNEEDCDDDDDGNNDGARTKQPQRPIAKPKQYTTKKAQQEAQELLNAQGHAAFGGKTHVDFKTLNRLIKYAEEEPESIASDDEEPEIIPLRPEDLTYHMYIVKRKTWSDDEEPEDEDSNQILTLDRFTSRNQANAAVANEILRYSGGDVDIVIDLKQQYSIHCDSEDGLTVMRADVPNGHIKVWVVREVYTRYQGTLPRFDNADFVNPMVYVIRQETQAPSNEQQPDLVIKSETEEFGHVYTTLVLANAEAADRLIEKTFHTESRRIEEVNTEKTWARRGLDSTLEDLEMRNQRFNMERGNREGRIVRVWVEDRKLAGPRN